ncbi:hypothetical protein [Parapedobacter lycopersici]|uniref:hypothetical protein n=1 Tax=Parapedobacter lycopersici TaxID=1864939 RepID=UPI00214D4583|nr:hypothetical protein [Parapedobacter lycopersici]
MLKIIASIGGIAAEKWLSNSSLVVLMLLTFSELLKEIIPALSIDEKLLDKLPEYRMLYVNKFEQLDRLFIQLENTILSEAEATEEYFKIREISIRIEDLDNSIHLPEKKKLYDRAISKFDVFIHNMYDLEDGD